MKAFLLAGGLGERLRPLTLTMPKCLVPVNGAPLLDYWLDLCALHGITHVLLNVSQHPSLVIEYLDRREMHHARQSNLVSQPQVELLIEGAPRGTASTVAAARSWVEGEKAFWILYADMLTDVDLSEMAEFHARHDGVMTMGLFHAPVPTAVGIVEMEKDGRIVGFVEKPREPKSDLANAGLYLARPELLECIPEMPAGVQADFGHDVLPRIVGRMYGHVIEQFTLDIGTPEALDRAASLWASRRSVKRSA
jgi:mannose-1-phosphate guanylyltransferase